MVVGELACDQVVPEGLDDHWCEGESPLWVQAKSRQPRLGQFRATDAARHVVNAWTRLHELADADPGARLLMVFEAPVEGIVDCDWRRPLSEYPDMTIPFTQGPVSREYVAGVPYNTQRLSSRRKMSSRLPRRLSL